MAGLAEGGPVVAAGEVAAARPLDLDHPRAEVGQLAGRERGGHRLLNRDDGEATKGVAHYEPTNAGRCFARNARTALPWSVVVPSRRCAAHSAASESVSGRDPPSASSFLVSA